MVLIVWWLSIFGWVGAIVGVFVVGIVVFFYCLLILFSLESVGCYSYGILFYVFSIGLLVGGFFFFGLLIFVAIGILVMVWGDGLVVLVG